jgi:hypothetical protein
MLFAAMLAIVGPRHEPWFDEGQAWLLARDATLWDLLAHRVRYEGTPGLWHAILWLLSRAGMPFTCLWMVSAALACGGAWIVLTRAPFPFWLRVGVVFSYFMAYQYAVVARNYALDLLLIPLIAATFASRLQRPVLYGVLLGLLANANAHSFVIAAALFCEFLVALWHRGGWRQGDFAGCAAYGALSAAAALQAWPPADAGFAPAPEVLRGVMMTAEAFIDRLEVWNPTLPGRKSLFWGFGISILLLIPSLLLCVRAGIAVLVGAVFAGLLAFSILKFANAWHAGVLYLFWVFAIWIGWSSLGTFTAARRSAIVASVAAIVSVNVYYTAAATLRDIREPYSAGPAAAQALAAARQPRDDAIAAAGIKTFAVQPWFTANAFANYQNGAANPAYYTWRTGENFKTFVTLDRWRAIVDSGIYGVLLLSLDFMSGDEIGRYVAVARDAGFCKSAELPGNLIWKTYARESDAMLVFTRCGSR